MQPVHPRTPPCTLWLPPRPGERGATLVEVLIVVAIIAMIAGGVAVFALPQYQKSQITAAETGARVLRGAIQQWQKDNMETSCPTVEQLVKEKFIDTGTNTTDPWNQPYSLSCPDGEVVVVSAGPDKKKGTADDIRIPKSAPAGGG